MTMADRARPASFATVDDRLADLCAELASVSERLEHYRHALAGRAGELPGPAPIGLEDSQKLALALALIRARRLRVKIFRADLFGDPAWDMLLDLYVARLSGKSIYVGALALAANVPSSTALRVIHDLALHGEIVRRPDPDDGRRVLVEISDEANNMVDRAVLAYSGFVPTGSLGDRRQLARNAYHFTIAPAIFPIESPKS